MPAPALAQAPENVLHAVRRAEFDAQVLTFDEPELAEPLEDCWNRIGPFQRGQDSDLHGLRLRKRNRRRQQASGQDDELASVHSITRCAHNSTDRGFVSPGEYSAAPAPTA